MKPTPITEWLEHDEDTGLALHRVLRFTGWTYADLLHNSVARNEVRYYLQVTRFIERRGEVLELEQQWNPLGRPE